MIIMKIFLSLLLRKGLINTQPVPISSNITKVRLPLKLNRVEGNELSIFLRKEKKVTYKVNT